MCALVTGLQTCALPIWAGARSWCSGDGVRVDGRSPGGGAWADRAGYPQTVEHARGDRADQIHGPVAGNEAVAGADGHVDERTGAFQPRGALRLCRGTRYSDRVTG